MTLSSLRVSLSLMNDGTQFRYRSVIVEAFDHRLVAVDPAVLGGGHDHRMFAADLWREVVAAPENRCGLGCSRSSHGDVTMPATDSARRTQAPQSQEAALPKSRIQGLTRPNVPQSED